MKANLIPWVDLDFKPEFQQHIQSFLIANLPYFQNIEQIGHKWKLRHNIAAQFMNAKIHNDWQFFLNELSVTDTLAIYEAIIVIKTILSESDTSFTFLGD